MYGTEFQFKSVVKMLFNYTIYQNKKHKKTKWFNNYHLKQIHLYNALHLISEPILNMCDVSYPIRFFFRTSSGRCSLLNGRIIFTFALVPSLDGKQQQNPAGGYGAVNYSKCVLILRGGTVVIVE